MSIRWDELHIHHHGPEMNRLVVDAVPLAIRALDGAGYREVSFQRDWRSGPHIRVVAQRPSDVDRDTASSELTQVLRSILSVLPTVAVDRSLVRLAHARMLEEEGVASLPDAWCDDNQWHWVDHDWRLESFGDTGLHDLTWRFLHLTNEHAFDLNRLSTKSSLILACLDLIVAVVSLRWPSGLRGGFVSMRSHAEAFLQRPGHARVRKDWDAFYERHRYDICARVRIDADRPFVCPSVLHALDEASTSAIALFEMGQLPPVRRPTRLVQSDLSEFHRRMADSDWFEEVGSSGEFAAFRIVLNLVYLQLYRGGLSGFDRSLVCHLIANAAEDIYGTRATDLWGLVSS